MINLKGGDFKMMHKNGLHMISFWLLIIGGLNWLVFALLKWDVGQLVGGMSSTPAKVIYVVVGLAALYEAFSHGTRCKECWGEMEHKSGGM